MKTNTDINFPAWYMEYHVIQKISMEVALSPLQAS